MTSELTLTRLVAVVFFLVLVICGRQFRENWKAQAEGWQTRAWAYGIPILISFVALAFIPLSS